eukprot:scaffold63748_cov51-Attheya_sp.AAC.1
MGDGVQLAMSFTPLQPQNFRHGHKFILSMKKVTCSNGKPFNNPSPRPALSSSLFSTTESEVNEQIIIGTKNAQINSVQVIEELDLEPVPTTLPEAVSRFFLGPDKGPILTVACIGYFFISRWTLGSLSMTDGAVMLTSVVFWWLQEHWMHGHLLHSKFDWMGKTIHEDHHATPYYHISIDPAWLILSWLWTVHAMLRLALPLTLALSATIGYASAGLVYIWAHYIVHTKARPISGHTDPISTWWHHMRTNHIRHHRINHDYWLGFTVPLIDDIFGTNPPLSQA